MTLHDPLDPRRLRRLRRTPRGFVSSVSRFLGCGRHGCLFEGHDSSSTPHPRVRSTLVSIRGVTTPHPPPPRAHTPRPETPVAFGSTYTALHCVTIRWGRSPTASFLRLAVVYDAPFRTIVGPSSMKHTRRRPRVGPRRRRRPARADGCATSRVRDDRSRAMSLAFDEFGRPFIIIKVRARPRRARGGGRARARASERRRRRRRRIHPSSIRARAIDDDARRGRGLTGTTRAGTREKVSRSWNRGAAREHRGGEERGEDVEVVSGTKGARAG